MSQGAIMRYNLIYGFLVLGLALFLSSFVSADYIYYGENPFGYQENYNVTISTGTQATYVPYYNYGFYNPYVIIPDIVYNYYNYFPTYTPRYYGYYNSYPIGSYYYPNTYYYSGWYYS